MSAKRHKHTFDALWWNFGPYKDQTVHVHSCHDPECDRAVIGTGRECDAESEHHRETLLAHTEEPPGKQWSVVKG